MQTKTRSNIHYDKIHNIFNVIDTIINAEHLGHSVIVPNICNIKSNKFHNGFASELASEFPIALQNYELLTNADRQLGHCQISQVRKCKNTKYSHKIYIANIMCQTGFNSKNSRSRNINYGALCMGLFKMNHFIKNNSNEDSEFTVHTHKYLINYLGDDNRFVSYLLEDTIKDKEITIYLK